VDREVAMTVRRRSCPPVAESARSRLAGQGATSLGFGAAPRTSAASATFPWLIHAPWLFGGAGVPLNHRQARIHRNNRRVPPPDVTPVMFCDDCDERGAGRSRHTIIAAAIVNRRAGRMLEELAWPPVRNRGATALPVHH
jgi:hypothetical protein